MGANATFGSFVHQRGLPVDGILTAFATDVPSSARMTTRARERNLVSEWCAPVFHSRMGDVPQYRSETASLPRVP